MERARNPFTIYQLRIVLRGISPLIWRRVLVHDITTLAQLHDIIQILFAWRDEHLYDFHIYGKDYGTSGADTRGATLSQFPFHKGGVVPMTVRDFIGPSVYLPFKADFTPNMKEGTDDSHASTLIARCVHPT